MIDKERIKELIDFREKVGEKTSYNYPYSYSEFAGPVIEALGDNQDEIIEYFKTLTKREKDHLYFISDEIYDKFYNDEMFDALDKYLDAWDNVFLGKVR